MASRAASNPTYYEIAGGVSLVLTGRTTGTGEGNLRQFYYRIGRATSFSIKEGVLRAGCDVLRFTSYALRLA
jgi:hypothetical protein